MRFTLISLLIVKASASYAQQFKRLKAGIGFGYSIDWPTTRDKSSILLYFEPAYRITDKVAVGVRLETGTNGSMSISSYGINGQYYFSNRKFRSFAGIGISYFHPGLSEAMPYGNRSREEETVLGFYPRVGFELGHLSITTDYNIVSSSNALIYEGTTGRSSDGKLGNNYGSVKVGLLIGGGRKK